MEYEPDEFDCSLPEVNPEVIEQKLRMWANNLQKELDRKEKYVRERYNLNWLFAGNMRWLMWNSKS
jgi:hypothetical protein